jgi:hypothetical protein
LQHKSIRAKWNEYQNAKKALRQTKDASERAQLIKKRDSARNAMLARITIALATGTVSGFAVKAYQGSTSAPEHQKTNADVEREIDNLIQGSSGEMSLPSANHALEFLKNVSTPGNWYYKKEDSRYSLLSPARHRLGILIPAPESGEEKSYYFVSNINGKKHEVSTNFIPENPIGNPPVFLDQTGRNPITISRIIGYASTDKFDDQDILPFTPPQPASASGTSGGATAPRPTAPSQPAVTVTIDQLTQGCKSMDKSRAEELVKPLTEDASRQTVVPAIKSRQHPNVSKLVVGSQVAALLYQDPSSPDDYTLVIKGDADLYYSESPISLGVHGLFLKDISGKQSEITELKGLIVRNVNKLSDLLPAT